MKPTPEQLENLRRLNAFWDTVPPNAVNLDELDCGTHACLAGWAARNALLFHDPLGQGYRPKHSYLDRWLARVFGSALDDLLFAERGYWDGDEETASDWQVAKYRLSHAIEGTL